MPGVQLCAHSCQLGGGTQGQSSLTESVQAMVYTKFAVRLRAADCHGLQGPCNATWGPIVSAGRRLKGNEFVALVPDDYMLTGIHEAGIAKWEEIQVLPQEG